MTRRLMCPFAGVIYRDVPGYREGYGCPVCKGISIKGHLLMTEPVVVPPSLGLDEECYRTAKHLGVNGCQKAVRWHVDDVITDIENDRRYFVCPGCDKPFVLAIGLLDTQIAREKTRRVALNPCGKQGCVKPAVEEVFGSLHYYTCSDHKEEILKLVSTED